MTQFFSVSLLRSFVIVAPLLFVQTAHSESQTSEQPLHARSIQEEVAQLFSRLAADIVEYQTDRNAGQKHNDQRHIEQALLHFLEQHQQEGDVVAAVRASLASLQSGMDEWDLHHGPHRDVDYEKVKQINKPKAH